MQSTLLGLRAVTAVAGATGAAKAVTQVGKAGEKLADGVKDRIEAREIKKAAEKEIAEKRGTLNFKKDSFEVENTPVKAQSLDTASASGAPTVGGSVNQRDLDLVTSHPDAHSLGRHGGQVTDDQLMRRALTGVAPDGHKKEVKGKTIVPPMSSAFFSDELLIYADQAVRKNGILDAVIASHPGDTVVTVLPTDAGDLGVDLGRGFERVGGSKFNPTLEGAPRRVDGLRSVQATYEFNPSKNRWETITIFPSR